MSDVQPQEQFELFHRTTCKDIELETLRLQQESAKEPVSPIVPELVSMLREITSKLSPEGMVAPEAMLRAGLDAMDIVEAKRFVLNNLLEALKRGDKVTAVFKRFQDLGLLSHATPGAKPASISSDADVIRDLQKGRGLLKRIGLATAQIATNAFRSIPKYVEIEPSISIVGFVPVLTFALKGKGVTVHDLYETLKGPGRFYRE